MTVKHMARPGAKAIQGAASTKARASLIIKPQSELGGCAPIPRKLSAAPSRIANVTRKLPSTAIGGGTFAESLAARDVVFHQRSELAGGRQQAGC